MTELRKRARLIWGVIRGKPIIYNCRFEKPINLTDWQRKRPVLLTDNYVIPQTPK